MYTPAILAIDIGSSSVRAALYDYDARPLGRLAVMHKWTFTPTDDGGSEMNADEAFLSTSGVIDELLARASRGRIEITHVALCSFWHSLMGVDARGRPTTPVLGWADTRSRKYSARLKKRFDETEIHNRTGAHFHSSFWPAKLLWLQNEWPQGFGNTATWMGFGDYVAMRLCGKSVTSVSMASATGIFAQRECSWDAQLLRYMKVSQDRLPLLASSRTPLKLSSTTRRRWPQLTNSLLLPCVGDGAADHVGSCGVSNGRASIMIGTSAAMRVAFEGEPPKYIPQGLWSYRVDEKRVVMGGALSDGGNLYDWCLRRFKIPSDAEGEIRKRGAANHSLTVLPFFHGERSTGYREGARGEIIGLSASHDGSDVLQACMESVAYRLAAVRGLLKTVGKLTTITASGGALRDSSVWPQIIADVLGQDIVLSTARESASRGAVLLALESIGKIDSIASLESGEGLTLAFHPACHAVYKRARASHEAAISKAHGTQS